MDILIFALAMTLGLSCVMPRKIGQFAFLVGWCGLASVLVIGGWSLHGLSAPVLTGVAMLVALAAFVVARRRGWITSKAMPGGQSRPGDSDFGSTARLMGGWTVAGGVAGQLTLDQGRLRFVDEGGRERLDAALDEVKVQFSTGLRLFLPGQMVVKHAGRSFRFTFMAAGTPWTEAIGLGHRWRTALAAL